MNQMANQLLRKCHYVRYLRLNICAHSLDALHTVHEKGEVRAQYAGRQDSPERRRCDELG